MRKHPYALAAILICGATAVASDASYRPDVMAALGDSITAATFADTPAPETPPQASSDEELRALFDPRWPASWFEHKDTFSWASGRDIRSHYVRLKEYLQQSEGEDLRVLNLADSGRETSDLSNQVARLLARMREGKYGSLKYLTLFIGANDICANDKTPPPVRDAKIRQSLANLFGSISGIRQSEPIRILVAGLPRIPDLGQPSFQRAKTLLGLSCIFVRDRIFHYCKSLLDWGSQEEYRSGLEVVAKMNRILRSSARDAVERWPNLEIAYSDALFESDIPLGELAFDCFHPNQLGQQHISDLLWEEQPWFH